MVVYNMEIIEITKEQVEEVFRTSKNQWEYLKKLYLLVYPNWSDIKKLKGFVHVSDELDLFIIGKSQEFDRIHHPDVLAGGMWMNYGFGSDRKLEGCQVLPAPYELA